MIKINEVGIFRAKRIFILLAIFGLVGISKARLLDSKQEILVGGIFHGDDELTQIAFKNAIKKINSESFEFTFETMLFNISRTDSFKAQTIVCHLLEEGVDVIFGPGTPETSGIVASMAEKFEIPHLVYHWKTRSLGNPVQRPKMTLNLYPDSDVLAEAFASVLVDFDWKSYTIVYENKENLIRLKDILQITEPTSKPISIMQLGEEDEYASLLKEVHSRGDSYVILDISTEKLIPFFKEAAEVKMLTEYNNYYVTNLDMHTIDLSVLGDVKSNITCLRQVDFASDDLYNALVTWRSRELNGIEVNERNVTLEAALVYDAVKFYYNALKLFAATDRKIPKSTQSCSDAKRGPRTNFGIGYLFTNFMKNTETEGMTHKIKFNNEERYNGSRTDFKLEILELYKTKFNKIGFWEREIHYDRDAEAMDPDQKLTEMMSTKTFTIVSKLGEPFLMLKESEEGVMLEGNARFEGFCIDLIMMLQKELHFKWVLEVVPDNAYGSYDPVKKTWDGLVKYLLDRKADLAVADLTITYERKTAVDFTMPYMNLGIGILHTKPVKKDADLFSFLHPLDAAVWFYTGVAYISITILVFVLSRIAPCDWESSHPCIQEPEELESVWKFPNCLWLAIGSMMGQGCDLLPKSASTRIAAGTWWFFALIMLASYTANLAAFLTMDRMGKTIEGAEDLAKQVDIKYGAMKRGSTMRFFKESNFSTYQRMWAFMETNADLVHVESNAEGVARVKKGNGMYAYLMESVPMEYQTNKDPTLRRAGDLLDSKSYGIALPLNSPYRKQFSAQILKLAEGGHLIRLKDKWWNKDQVEADEKTTDDLKIENVGGVFLVLVGGCCVAFGFAVLEFFMNATKIAIRQKETIWTVIKSELFFVFNLRNTTKPVPPQSSTEATESRRSSFPRSLPRSRFGSETRSFKNKSSRSLNFDVSHTKSLLDLH